MLTGKIIGLGSYLPPKILTNDDLSKIVDTNDEWITERTGIKRRHIADAVEDKASTMACKAALAAIEDAGISGSEIDLIVAASTTPDVVFPSIACCVQGAVGADGCACFDVNSACPGFIAAYNTAQSYIESGNAKTVLVLGAECLTNFVDWEDRGTCILFGDGAGAAVLRAEEGMKNSFIMKASMNRGACLHCEAMKQPKRVDEEGFLKSTFMYMQGREVFRFVVTEVPALIDELSKKYEFDLGEVDHFVFHQANRRIIEATAKKLGVSLEKFPMNIQDTGNTSSASIPILLTQMKKEGKLKKGDKIVMSSFGGGLTWGANYFEY
ncbi:MAG: ketoacyl-ACP synthase III [Clostridiales bacterium]|nr:ketoacyl-ACP synthase III [Clostridiales bacterium]MBR6484682.1 ketoacyl-ACP synthase III [Clostridiales bacterium]